MKDMEAAVAAIRTCKTLDSLNSMLARFELTDSHEIIDCLNNCMYNPQTFNSSESITAEDELEFAKQIFLTGTWRLNEYYDLIGIKMAGANA